MSITINSLKSEDNPFTIIIDKQQLLIWDIGNGKSHLSSDKWQVNCKFAVLHFIRNQQKRKVLIWYSRIKSLSANNKFKPPFSQSRVWHPWIKFCNITLQERKWGRANSCFITNLPESCGTRTEERTPQRQTKTERERQIFLDKNDKSHLSFATEAASNKLLQARWTASN